jgi:hypothetical protein
VTTLKFESPHIAPTSKIADLKSLSANLRSSRQVGLADLINMDGPEASAARSAGR